MMKIASRERKALGAARDPDGVDRGELSKHGIGEKTIADLIQCDLLEEFPNPVTGEKMYRTTPAGEAAQRAPAPAKPKSARSKIKMLKPRFPVADTRIAKPGKR
jgi:hypothetical protein